MLSLAQRASLAQSVPNGQTISRIGSILRLAYEVKVFFKSVLVFQCILISITRLKVGRVKPLLDLHRLCAHDAIMIPYKVWSGRQFPVPESLPLTFNTSLGHNF